MGRRFLYLLGAMGLGLFLPQTAALADTQGNVPSILVALPAALSPSDTQELKLDASTLQSLPLILSRDFAPGATAPGRGPLRFASLSGTLLQENAPIPSGGVRLVAVQPGVGAVRLRSGLVRVSVLSITPTVRTAQTLEEGLAVPYLSLSRDLPPELALSPVSASREPEAVTFVIQGDGESLPASIQVLSFDAEGHYLDALHEVPLVSGPCQQEISSTHCATAPRLRLVTDMIERNHPAVSERALVAAVGGHVEVQIDDRARRGFWVGAPRQLEPGGPGRYSMKMRARILNMQAGGPPAVGADAAEAKRIVAEEMLTASRMWGQCGVVLGPPESWDIEVVDPPTSTLMEIGCGGASLASGGQVDFLAGGSRVSLRVSQGQTPESVAVRLATLLVKRGLRPTLYRNAQVRSAALSSVDVVVRDMQGTLLELSAAGAGPLSTDPTMQTCLGELDLADGLDHFDDDNAASGTLEERTLLRSVMDTDKATIDLVVVPIFGGTGRIGESFIRSTGGSIENVVLLDRAGIRAGARSLTLAHEIGHILLEMPGHPDDFGVDTPTSLMDADAADATIFGPRRLTLEDCRRALRQSGRDAPVPLISDWPLPLERYPQSQ